MKANELMIGDWVRNDFNEVQQVVELREGSIMLAYNDMYNYDEIDPIPITPEILEKNGFKQDPKSRSRKSHQIITNDVYISWWKGRLNIMYKPFVGHSTNHINCDGKYVHELQHALRLAGIEKEIVL